MSPAPTGDLLTHLAGQFPPLAELPDDLASRVAQRAMPIAAPAGTVMFQPGQACQALPLLLAGSLRVCRQGDNGREISLYRVRPGDICIVTASCLLGGDAYPATGLVETDLRGLALPRPLFLTLLDRQAAFRQRVFALFGERLTELMQLVEAVTFRRLDERLAALLAARAPLLLASHQDLADEIGSVREIVSRLLKQFEEQGWVALGRNRIEVLDPPALADYLRR
jgi:CRP/FNR family transcriptional regulator